ncbi:MAG: hypothetical protein HFI75_04765 [Lachnospiraceae bacterium]|nr:hypothetical protein [Lachnospiraceae bacterium]
MKKIISLLLTGTLLITLNTACSNVSEDKRPKISQNSPQKTVTTISSKASVKSPSPVTIEAIIADPINSETISNMPLKQEPIINRQTFDRTNSNILNILNDYKLILNNHTSFIDSNKNIFINQLNNTLGTEMEITEFTIIDLDGSGVPEVVLALSPLTSKYMSHFLILHNQNGTFYSYVVPYRGFEDLKVDGTFFRSGGVMNYHYSRISFNHHYDTNTSYTMNDFISFEAYDENTNKTKFSYYVNNQSTTEDELNQYRIYQDNKPDATWYSYTKENIESLFSP